MILDIWIPEGYSSLAEIPRPELNFQMKLFLRSLYHMQLKFALATAIA